MTRFYIPGNTPFGRLLPIGEKVRKIERVNPSGGDGRADSPIMGISLSGYRPNRTRQRGGGGYPHRGRERGVVSRNVAKIGTLAGIRPGNMKQAEIAGRHILLANVDGRFYATGDTCTHEDALLSTGSLRGEVVKCALHGSRFKLRAGEVMENPAERNLETCPVLVEGEDILVSLEPAERRP